MPNKFRASQPSVGWDGALQWAEVTVTSAQLLAIRATPITLVAAPGVGKVLEFLGGILILDYNSAAYAGVQNCAVRYNNSTGALASATITGAGLFDQTADTALPITGSGAAVAKTVCENKPLVLHNTGAAEMTTGNSPVRVKVAYRVWTTGW